MQSNLKALEDQIRQAENELKKAGPIHSRDVMRHLRRLRRKKKMEERRVFAEVMERYAETRCGYELRDYDRPQQEAANGRA